jgi:hypothetical protein
MMHVNKMEDTIKLSHAVVCRLQLCILFSNKTTDLTCLWALYLLKHPCILASRKKVKYWPTSLAQNSPETSAQVRAVCLMNMAIEEKMAWKQSGCILASDWGHCLDIWGLPNRRDWWACMCSGTVFTIPQTALGPSKEQTARQKRELY